MWERGHQRLVAWVEEHGHARVPPQYITPDGYRLGKWVHNQRTLYRSRSRVAKGPRLSDERVARLESVTGWVWNTRSPAASVCEPINRPVKTLAAPARQIRTIPADAFDARVHPWVVIRALDRWLDARRLRRDFSPFTEAQVQNDPAFKALVSQEALRASLAALVATGEARVHRNGKYASWRDMLAAADLDDGWQFQGAFGQPGARPVPVEVLTVYQAHAEKSSAPAEG